MAKPSSAIPPPVSTIGSKATLFVVACVVLAVATMATVVAIYIFHPEDNVTIVTTIMAMVTPLLVAFLAAAIQQVHLAVNSRLTQLLQLTAVSSRAKGKLDSKE